MVTWHTWSGDMLHLKEILRFSYKNSSTQAGIFPQILSHMVMHQNLTTRSRCATNTFTCRVVELWVYKGEPHTRVVLALVLWGTSLPQHRLTVIILMYGLTPTCGRRGRKELKRSLPLHSEEEGGPLWFPSLGKGEASVERVLVRALSYLMQQHRYWEGFNIWQGQTRRTVRNISPAERDKRFRWD